MIGLETGVARILIVPTAAIFALAVGAAVVQAVRSATVLHGIPAVEQKERGTR